MLPAIRVEHLSKQYKIGLRQQGDYRTLRESLSTCFAAPFRRFRQLTPQSSCAAHASPVATAPVDTFWALKDVSFDVDPGEVVGIIGRNGAGKSTLLKILSRITEPTKGRVAIRGRVASLLEVGTGFHPELTGRENVYMNGAILGMSRSEIDRKFDDIVAFSGVETFLETPIKRYSSGMQVRLAFAVAAYLEPEILIVDEVLAVGDAEFQRKCTGKMSEIANSGRTVLLVSHNMPAVSALCTRALFMRNGQICADGMTDDILTEYMLCEFDSEPATKDLCVHGGRTVSSVPIMTSLAISDDIGNEISHARMGHPLNIHVNFRSEAMALQPILGIVVKTGLGSPVFGVNNRFISTDNTFAPAAKGEITCHFDALPLMPGTYLLDLYFGSGSNDLDVIHDATSFEVVASDVFGTGKLPPSNAGPVFQRATWSLLNDETEATGAI